MMPANGRHGKASVVIVGAGVIGLAVAVTLRHAGVDGVIVVDRNPAPGMGSTARANGGVRAQFATPINVEFSKYTIDGLARLDETSGGLVGLRRVGYLFLTGTEEGERRLRDNRRVQSALGVAVRELSPDSVASMVPFVRAEGLRAATFCATDGIIDPSGVVAALAGRCRDLGVTVLLDEHVTGISRGSVRTSRRHIETGYVVNAAGPQARAVAALAGVDLPVLPYRRSIACTEPVPGFPDVIPMCVDVDTGVHIRREAGGFLIGYANSADSPSERTDFDPAFLDQVAERLPNRFPFLLDVPINSRKCWSGLYPETPDQHAVIDGAPDDPRFIQCAGFGGHGIMHSLAAGQAVAEIVVHGRCSTFDLDPFRLSRFGEDGVTMETAVL